MNGREFGEALERELEDRIAAFAQGYIEQAPGHYYAICDMRHAVRAALQSITPGAGKTVPEAKTGPHTDAWMAAWDELRKGNPTFYYREECGLECAVLEIRRLQTIERWVGEFGKPALQYCVNAYQVTPAQKALAALPAMPTSKPWPQRVTHE